MASVTARRVGPGRKHKDRDQGPGAPVFIPPPVTLPQKNESLDRRIRNIEALGNGVFLGNVLASYLELPGLVGFWPMSSVQRSTGNAYDLSGQGRTLTYNGNPAYTFHNGLVAYIDLDGTGDFLSRADETDLDITGDGESAVYTSGAAGLTIGGWFWADAFTGDPVLINKWLPTGNQKSYLLHFTTTGAVKFAVSSTGADDFTITTTTVATTGTWAFCVGRYIPSTSIAAVINPDTTTNITSIPASIFNSTASLNIGRLSDTNSNLLNGRAALCFLCANSLGDDLISSLFQSSRVLFSV